MGDNISELRGGRLIGQPQQLVITSQEVVPQLYLELLDDVGGIPSKVKVLRVFNPLSGLAVFCPLSPAGARRFAVELEKYASEHLDQGGQNGSTALHE